VRSHTIPDPSEQAAGRADLGTNAGACFHIHQHSSRIPRPHSGHGNWCHRARPHGHNRGRSGRGQRGVATVSGASRPDCAAVLLLPHSPVIACLCDAWTWTHSSRSRGRRRGCPPGAAVVAPPPERHALIPGVVAIGGRRGWLVSDVPYHHPVLPGIGVYGLLMSPNFHSGPRSRCTAAANSQRRHTDWQ
jgi:hypothetical protein